MYVADDVIFIAPNAIELLVREKLERGRFMFVSANVVAHPTLSHVHARLGAWAAPAPGSSPGRQTTLPAPAPDEQLPGRAAAGALHAPDTLNLASPVDDPAARREAEAKLEDAHPRRRAGLEFGYGHADPCSSKNPMCLITSHRSFVNHYWLRSLRAFDFVRCRGGAVTVCSRLHACPPQRHQLQLPPPLQPPLLTDLPPPSRSGGTLTRRASTSAGPPACSPSTPRTSPCPSRTATTPRPGSRRSCPPGPSGCGAARRLRARVLGRPLGAG